MSRIILITGGSRGIGAATARLAAARGYRVAISYQQQSGTATELVRSLEDQGTQALAIQADVSQEAQVRALFEAVDSHFGGLDVLVNNAGMLERQMRLEDMDAERLQRVFAVNVIGSFLCAREAVKRLSTRHGGRGGSIVNLSSMAARLGSPNEYIDYAATKGAIDSLTIGLAKEVAQEGIRVNAVRPGLIDTQIHASGGEPGRIERLRGSIPLGRGGEAEEVANAILWLASDEASYTTGSFIDVSGGR